jgi:hypothetical protein
MRPKPITLAKYLKRQKLVSNKNRLKKLTRVRYDI